MIVIDYSPDTPGGDSRGMRKPQHTARTASSWPADCPAADAVRTSAEPSGPGVQERPLAESLYTDICSCLSGKALATRSTCSAPAFGDSGKALVQSSKFQVDLF